MTPGVRLALALIVALASVSLRPGAAAAYRLNVVAASELRLEPSVRAGAASLAVRAHLRDDRGAPLARRAVRLVFRGAGIADLEREAVTDANGDASATVEVGASRTLVVEGRFAGDSTAAGARARIEVDLDAPFVTPELLVPGEGVAFESASFEAVLTVRVGQVQTIAPGRLAVEVSQALDGGRRRSLVAGETDATGRAVLPVAPARFGWPGTVRLVPRVDLGGGRVVEGVGRELLVRGRTSLSLLRAAPRDDDGDGVTLHGALILSGGAPVPNAAVRLLRGDRTLVAARTDARGAFSVRVGPESLGEPGVEVRAVFEPTEPWYLGAESGPVALTEPAPPPIRWTWAATPLALAVLAIAWISLRCKPIEAPVAPAPRPVGTDHVERVAVSASGVRLRVTVVDRATGERVAGARVRLGDGAWRDDDGEAIALEGAKSLELRVEAEGFAPRAVAIELSRPGEYRVQVAVRSWREELFARVRPWLAPARGGEAPVTPREAAEAGGGALATLVAHVERGSYGPEVPDAKAVQRADDLAGAARADAASRVLERR